MSIDLFEIATRKKFRFPSAVGELTVEQLWDLPLLNKKSSGLDLDTLARGVNTELKSITEESFVEVRPDPRRAELEQKLDILKRIIAVKQLDAQAAAAAADKANERSKLLEALADAEKRELASVSKEDILERLKKLES